MLDGVVGAVGAASCDMTCPTQSPTITHCYDKHVDVVFVVDGSGSVSYSNFRKSLEFVEKVSADTEQLFG